MSNSAAKCSMPSVNDRSVSAFSRSPMCWETNARSPLARQNVLFSSAPQARTGAANRAATRSGSGAYPRARRSSDARPRNGRTTESSVLMWIGRSWVRKASAMPPSRSSASSSA